MQSAFKAYIDELVAFVAETGADKAVVLEKVKRHFSEPSVLAEVQRRLGLIAAPSN